MGYTPGLRAICPLRIIPNVGGRYRIPCGGEISLAESGMYTCNRCHRRWSGDDVAWLARQWRRLAGGAA